MELVLTEPINPNAFCMVTPKDLPALERGVKPNQLAFPRAVQACSEEAEAAALRGLKTAGACRLVFASSNNVPE
jgi:hypothetical protein